MLFHFFIDFESFSIYNNYYAQNIKNQLIGSGIFEKVIASDDSMKLN